MTASSNNNAGKLPKTDENFDKTHNPKHLWEFIGQDKIKENLAVFILAARQDGKPLNHLLFVGPPGCGKTTLVHLVANEMKVNIKIISGSAIDRAGDLAAILMNLRAGDVLFIDEIHRLGQAVGEILYPAMEDYALDIIIGKGLSARSIRLKLPRFTVIGTTSKISKLDPHLRKNMFEFDFVPYTEAEISNIMTILAKQEEIGMDGDATLLMAKYCQGSPSKVLTLLRKVQKYAIVRSDGNITAAIAKEALDLFDEKRDAISRERQLIPEEVKMIVWRRDGGKCVKCGSQERLEFDHIIPVSEGGSNTARNIQLLCESCNRSKGARIA